MEISHNKLKLDGLMAIVHPSGYKKPVLVKLRSTNSEAFTGYVQNNKLGSPEEDMVPVEQSEIMYLVLNPNEDKVDTVAGVKIEPFFEREKYKGWGNILVYRKLSGPENKIIHSAIEATKTAVKDNNLGFLLPTTLEIRRNSGKPNGFCYLKKGETDYRIVLCPKAFVDESISGCTHILTHELSHPLWQHYLPDDQKAKWVSLYSTHNVVHELKDSDLESVLADVSQANSIGEYKKTGEDKEKQILKIALKWIKATHHVDAKMLDILLEQKLSIEIYWPKTPLHLSEINTSIISSYASTSVVEFFCESMSKFFCNEELPETISSRCKKAVKAMRPK